MNPAKISEPQQPALVRSRPSGGQALVHRIRLLCAMIVAAMIFWHFGWRVAKPTDPLGAASLLMIPEGQGVVIMAELLGLSVVVSGLAVAICGAGSAVRGPLAVAVGLATLGLRGGRMDRLVQYRLTATTESGVPLDPFPVWALVSETWLWLALIGVGLVVGRWVEGWFGPAEQPARPVVSNTADLRNSFGAVSVAAFLAWIILLYTVGSDPMPLAQGQIYFGVFAAFLTSALFAHWFLQPSSRLWTLLTIALVATAGYIHGSPPAEVLESASTVGAYVPLHSLARPLPIEYAALGSIGVLLEADAMVGICAMIGLRIEPADAPPPR